MKRFFLFFAVLTIVFLSCSDDFSREPEKEGFSGEEVASFDDRSGVNIPLPKYMTDKELQYDEQDMEVKAHYSTPPAGEVYFPAEFSRTSGVIVNIYNYSNGGTMWDYFGSLSEAIVQAGARPWIIQPNQQRIDYSLTNVLNPRGITIDDIETFIVDSRLETYWARDYSPWFIYEDGERKVLNFEYYPTRPGANNVPLNIADILNEDVYSTGIRTEGGNFMTDGNGTCWMTTGIFNRNSGWSESQIAAIFYDYAGCDTVSFITPLYLEGSKHIDMFAKVLNQDTILVAYSTSSLGATQHEINSLDTAAAEFAATPKPDGGEWNIVRIPMAFDDWNSDDYYWGLPGRMYFTHTNALIVNNTVIVPTYGKGTDSEALQIYGDAMPEFEVVGVNSINIIGFGGAVHCTTMQVPELIYSSCGDGVVQEYEECEKNYLKGKTCHDFGFAGGVLSCTDQCTFDVSGCFGASTCGDGIVDPGELCDGDIVNCNSLDPDVWESGIAHCNSDCMSWDTSGCIPFEVAVPNDCEEEACVNNSTMNIPDNRPSGITSVINVGNFNATVDTVKVVVNITHTWRGDLIVRLTSPQGTVVTLHNRSGGSAKNLNIDTVLSNFNGENPVGEWILFVSDNASRDIGTLDNWSIQITPDAPLLCGNGEIDEGEFCDGNNISCNELDPETWESGTANCNSTCSGWNTSSCTAYPVCGNNIVEAGEVCDGNTISCSNIPGKDWTNGTATCLNDCSGWNESNCSKSDGWR
jgi:agmatine/peptidylarginine deiminase/subtilisin-like proprotein convertase family protein